MSIVFLLVLVILWLIFSYEVSFDWDEKLIMWYTYKKERRYKILIKNNEYNS